MILRCKPCFFNKKIKKTPFKVNRNTNDDTYIKFDTVDDDISLISHEEKNFRSLCNKSNDERALYHDSVCTNEYVRKSYNFQDKSTQKALSTIYEERELKDKTERSENKPGMSSVSEYLNNIHDSCKDASNDRLTDILPDASIISVNDNDIDENDIPFYSKL
ncbi:hypothetical protein CWI36_1149p0010 [Hamiltosporidium magnivora]|uniref:Uncharacterized protein n=1 Tax=Hamiltosporidium magnivora TaxID=148818 RepID=A0A4Q9L454_9MICR|nr:hypothetical protein CWI36_1149p0010 [Hamiltosporidium magnivora]